MAYDVEAVRAHFPALKAAQHTSTGRAARRCPNVVADAVASALTSPVANRGSVTLAERNADEIVLAARAAMGGPAGRTPPAGSSSAAA